MSILRVATVQWKIRPARRFADFVAHAAAVVTRAAAEGAELLVLPEYLTYELLATHPHAAELRDRQMEAAFWAVFPPALDAYLDLFGELAARHGFPILAGSTWHELEGHPANSAFLVMPNGEVLRQTKIHLTPPEESWQARAGDELLIVDLGPARAGIAICYDIEFPEVARTLAERGATLILNPSWTTSPRGANRVRFCAQARAIENGLFVACASLVGSLGIPASAPLCGYGRAAILGPIENRLGLVEGVLAIGPDDASEAVIVADLDFARLRRARRSSEAPTWRHRRPDLYARWREDARGENPNTS